jgi:hypothetical protein
MQPQLGRPLQLGSHAHPCPLFPTEQKKPLRQIASPQEKHEPSSHCTPPRPSSSFGAGSTALALLGASAGEEDDLRVVVGAAPPQASINKTGTQRQIFTPLSVDDVRRFVKGVSRLRPGTGSRSAARACR